MRQPDGNGHLTNYSHRSLQRRLVTICLDYSIPWRVRRVLLGGQAMLHPEPPGDPSRRSCGARLSSESLPGGILAIDRCVPRSGSRVRGMLRHLPAAGITPSYPKRITSRRPLPMLHSMVERWRSYTLCVASIFSLSPDDPLQIWQTIGVAHLSGRDVVRRRGRESMFVLMRGCCVRTELAAALRQPVGDSSNRENL